MDRPTIEDMLLTAEAILGTPAESLLAVTNIPMAESALAAPDASFGGIEFYPDPVQKAAVLGSRVTRNHALPDGNKRVALMLMLAYIDQCGLVWEAPSQKQIADTFLALAAGEMSEEAFRDWVAAHVSGEVVELRRDAG
jgi:death-on-curing protein